MTCGGEGGVVMYQAMALVRALALGHPHTGKGGGRGFRPAAGPQHKINPVIYKLQSRITQNDR